MGDVYLLKARVAGAYEDFTQSINWYACAIKLGKLQYNPDRMIEAYGSAAKHCLDFILSYKRTEPDIDFGSQLDVVNREIETFSKHILDMSTDVSKAKEPFEFIHLSSAYLRMLKHYTVIRDALLDCMKESVSEEESK